MSVLTTSAAGLYAVKPRFQLLLAPIADSLAEHQVSPDLLTYGAIAIGVLGGTVLALSPQAPAILWTIPVLCVARLSLNALDGMVATRRGVARPWGKVLNEVCDRLADLAFFSPLLLLSYVNALWSAGALCSMLLVGFVGVLGETVTRARQYGGSMGKADRMACLGLAAIASTLLGSHVPLQVLPILVVGGSLVTVCQRLERIHAAL